MSLGAALQAARRAPFRRAAVGRQQLQTRSIRKNAHVEAWDGWRADSHKRFEMTASKVPALLLWGLVVPVAMFVLGNKEDNIRGGADYIEKRFIEDKEHFRLIHGEEDDE